MKRIISVLAVMAIMAALLAAMAVPAFAADGTFSGDGTNFGPCASDASRNFVEPGPALGDWMKLASGNNPSDRDLQCTQEGL